MKTFVDQILTGFIILLMLAAVTTAALEKMPVERLDLQAKLLGAVIKFSTRELDHIELGIVYVPEAKKIAQDFAKEVEKLNYNEKPILVHLILVETLDSMPPSVNVIYVTPGNEEFLDTISETASKKKIFSCTGVPEYVMQQKVALGFGEMEGKPQIILNLPVAKNTEHDFKNPKFLNLQTTGKLLLIK